jgi:site-specific DNA-methyltransferase (adenine-specific)
VFTPLYGKPGCVEDQLNLMEDSFWKRKDVKVLDPCAGIGNYSVVLIDKFMNGLSDEIPDSEERLKWILEEIIYVNEYQSKNLFIYLQLFDPENKYKINFYRGDYLTLNIKETFGVEKFDLICMNSPYQEMDGGNGASALPLYNLFIEKSIKDSNYIISINPSRWFAGGKGLEGFRKMMLSNKNLKEIIHISDPTLIFGSGVEIKGGISYMIINNTETYENCTFNGLKTVLTDFDILINPKYNKILNKIGLLNGLNNICIGRGDNVFGIQTNDKRVKNDGELICYMSKQKGYKKFIDVKDVKKSIWIDKWKVITAEASGTNKNLGVFGNSFIGKPFEVYSGSYISFVVSSENEANSLLSYIRSKFANFMLSLRKISQHIKPDTCKWIPMVPFDREWTDEQLFDYFNLTDEERNLVMTYDKKDKPKLNVEVVNELTTVL